MLNLTPRSKGIRLDCRVKRRSFVLSNTDSRQSDQNHAKDTRYNAEINSIVSHTEILQRIHSGPGGELGFIVPHFFYATKRNP